MELSRRMAPTPTIAASRPRSRISRRLTERHVSRSRGAVSAALRDTRPRIAEPTRTMTTIQRRSRSLPVRAVGLVGLTLAVAIASQLAAASRSPLAVVGTPPGGQADTVAPPVVADLDGGSGATSATPDDTIRINANIAFWSKKLTAHPTDFVAAEQLGESQIELA